MREPEEKGQIFYSVSEAVMKSGVPSHVLRYWEDELGLSIRRTAQGHRIYSEEDLATFQRVKELKEKGIQLKAIRLLFQGTTESEQLSRMLGQRLCGEPGEAGGKISEAGGKTGEADGKISEAGEKIGETEAQENSESDEEVEYEVIPKAETGTYRLFEAMLRNLISEAVAGQNEKLEAEMADLIRDEIEELYMQLRQDMGEREAAATQMPGKAGSGRVSLLRRVKRIFGQDRQTETERR